jgi:hypothetical protein
MSGVYHVYLILWRLKTRVGETRDTNGRYLLTFESRLVADELFRALQKMTLKANGSQYFNYMTRKTPQFWLYDTPRMYFYPLPNSNA